MSYILEALRRADAERQRGAVPGLHAQPAAAAQALQAPSARGVPLGWALAGAAVLLAAGAGAAWWWRPAPPPSGDPTQRPGAAGAPLGAGPLAPATSAAAVPQPAPAPAPIGLAPAPVRISPLPAPVAGLPAPPPTPVRAMAPGLPPQRALALGVPAASSPSPVAPLVRPAAAPAPGEAPPVMALADAPAGLRQQLAGLSLGGSVHGEQAAQRLVIINGQVFHEGDRVQPDLVVEQIRPRSVVLSVRGQRVALPL